MSDRGIIKWQPFDSCFSSSKVLNMVASEKERIKMPTLSEDQINNIEMKIIDSYNLKESITLDYYEEGKIKKIKGIIYNIDKYEKKIYLKHNYIYFKQILKVY